VPPTAFSLEYNSFRAPVQARAPHLYVYVFSCASSLVFAARPALQIRLRARSGRFFSQHLRKCDLVTDFFIKGSYTTIKQKKITARKEIKIMSVTTLTKENFETEVVQAGKPVLVDFWASWCGPCRMLSPIIDEIAEERSDIKVGKINVDEQPELANSFGVMSIPTLLLMKEGKVVSQAVGARPKEAVLSMIDG
jgi:thioredoxin 1